MKKKVFGLATEAYQIADMKIKLKAKEADVGKKPAEPISFLEDNMLSHITHWLTGGLFGEQSSK